VATLRSERLRSSHVCSSISVNLPLTAHCIAVSMAAAGAPVSAASESHSLKVSG